MCLLLWIAHWRVSIVWFYGAALVACPAVADETTSLINVTIAYILYFYVCLMYNKYPC